MRGRRSAHIVALRVATGAAVTPCALDGLGGLAAPHVVQRLPATVDVATHTRERQSAAQPSLQLEYWAELSPRIHPRVGLVRRGVGRGSSGRGAAGRAGGAGWRAEGGTTKVAGAATAPRRGRGVCDCGRADLLMQPTAEHTWARLGTWHLRLRTLRGLRGGGGGRGTRERAGAAGPTRAWGRRHHSVVRQHYCPTTSTTATTNGTKRSYWDTVSSVRMR